MNRVVIVSASRCPRPGATVTRRPTARCCGPRAAATGLLFLERDQPWYAANRDLADPSCCELAFYEELRDLQTRGARTSNGPIS